MIAANQTHEQKVNEYVDGVLDGTIVAGKLVRSACQRYVNDLDRIGDDDFPYYFDYDIAEQQCNFFPNVLVHTTGSYSDTPFTLFPWQAFVIWNLHGWRKIKDDFRRFKRAFISVARGNGKSALCSALAVQCFAFDYPVEVRAECYSFAVKSKQARIVFEESQRFIQKNKHLSKLCEMFKHNINIPSVNSRFEPMASEGHSLDGLHPHFVVLDEIHELQEHQRSVYEKIETSMGKRDQPLWVIITTAGTDESHLWMEEYTRAKNAVTRVTKSEHMFCYIAEIDDEDDELDESCWPKANPMLEYGVVKVDQLREMAGDAETDVLKRHSFRRYHANKLTTSLNRLISHDAWKAGSDKLPDLSDRECYAGYDAGWRDDLAALGFVFPLDEIDVGGQMKRQYAIRADVWLPDGCKRNLLVSPFKEWIDDGLLTVTQGNTTDIQAIFNCLEKRNEEYAIRVLAYDPNNAREFSTKAENEYGIETYGFQQTTKKYNEPIRELLAALAEGRILHGGDSLLAWCATNMAVKYDSADYVMPVKKRSQDKIDPIVAILMALSEAMYAEQGPSYNYYESGDLELI